MVSSCIIEYYKNHNVKDTLRQFNITYKQLKDYCAQCNFIKSSQQIKDTYKQTKITKHGSLEIAYKESYKNKLGTINNRYGSIELYNQIRTLNSCKTCKNNSGYNYPMQNPETVKKSNQTKKGK